ncbi:segregation and condensation protein A [Longibacter salinarum]|uniref:Segregation and condensation protein A n=1 Tax=Longibacter salinarum TaxID=1850348 RepID=A0A2A8D2I4_9BACT|nr:segregation/condensation protein A [Longibacter salinarum]PEN15091.1 segregation and condensation protein A [Longibacter salinarum]
MYRVSLQQFEGPMDLLLFFIRRDELDIYDIPIAQIADEYLAYVRLLEEIDLDGVADFIYMAALLINIKARMLLPTETTDEDGEVVDPRRELVERLLEYVRFKEASDQLAERRETVSDMYPRGEAASDRDEIQDSHDVDVDNSVYDLVKALGQMLQQAEEEEEVVHEVEPLRYSIEGQQEYVLERLMSEPRVPFSELCEGRSKPFIIATFLATLELARQQYLYVEIHTEDAIDFTLVERDEQPLIEDDPGVEIPDGVQVADDDASSTSDESERSKAPGDTAIGGDGAMTG